MVGKTPERCRQSHYTIDTQQHALSGTVTTYNLRRRSDHTVSTQQHALSGTVKAYNLRRRSDHIVGTQHHALSGAVTAYNVRRRRSDHTQQHALRGPKTHILRRISNHTINTRKQSLSGRLPMVGKTLKLHAPSDHTVNTQRQTLAGSLGMVGKTPKLQVEFPLHLVVYEVLTRLPVKTLSRFRCVSKPLSSFISDPHFQKLHALRSQQTPLLLVAKSDTTGVHFSTSTIHGEKLFKDFSLGVFSGPSNKITTLSFDIVQTCLGLVCLRINYNGALLIFNPSTAEVVTLPQCPDQLHDLCVGFGYTDFSDEFKVVRFFTRHLCDECDVDESLEYCNNEVFLSEIFTLGSSDGWRETRSPPPFMPFGYKHMPLVHGALHFLPSLFFHAHARDRHYIAAFDVHTEKYRRIRVPKIYFVFGDTDNLHQCHMTELRGSLCMSFNFFKSKKLLQLWFLKDYHGGKWVKEFNINLSYEPDLSSAFAVQGSGRVLLCVRFSKQERKLCYYNAKKNCIEKMFGANCSAMFYVDTILTPPLFGK